MPWPQNLTNCSRATRPTATASDRRQPPRTEGERRHRAVTEAPEEPPAPTLSRCQQVSALPPKNFIYDAAPNPAPVVLGGRSRLVTEDERRHRAVIEAPDEPPAPTLSRCQQASAPPPKNFIYDAAPNPAPVVLGGRSRLVTEDERRHRAAINAPAGRRASTTRRSLQSSAPPLKENMIFDAAPTSPPAVLTCRRRPPTERKLQREPVGKALVRSPPSATRRPLQPTASTPGKLAHVLSDSKASVDRLRKFRNTAETAPSIFLSFRFGEAMREAKALKSALEAANMSVTLCDLPPGEDIADAVVHGLKHCKLAVILGTKTYGQKTDCCYGTHRELRFIDSEPKPFFLVKMCENFAIHEARFRLSADISYFKWLPAAKGQRVTVPSELVQKIRSRLDSVMRDAKLKA